MAPRRWLDHPTLAHPTSGPVRTRLGVAPNHPSFRVGVLRTHLLTAALAHAAADNAGTSAHILLRWDDTDPTRARQENEPDLLNELVHIGQIPLTTTGLRQSQSGPRCRRALAQLREQGLTSEHNGAVFLDVTAADRLLRRWGHDPRAATAQAAVNTGVPLEPAEDSVCLVRSDGRALWHLASVIDDIHQQTTLIVRGSDKTNATALQVRLFHLLGPPAPPAFLFVPRLRATKPEDARISSLLARGIRPSALRWYLAEPFLEPSTAPPQTFADLVARLRAHQPLRPDARFDRQRLAAMDRKLSGTLRSTVARDELAQDGATGDPRIRAWVATHYRRPLPSQRRLCALLNSAPAYEPPPDHAGAAVAWLEQRLHGDTNGPAPPGLSWVLTGEPDLPGLGRGVEHLPAELLHSRLAAARQALSRARAVSSR